MSNADVPIVGLPLPRWIYVPGASDQADHVPLTQAKALLPTHFEGCVASDDPVLLYGLALNGAGFFWESHEILEAVWKLAPQGGRDRIMLRACIQISNANLKLRMLRPRAVERLLREAMADLNELSIRSSDSAGFAASFPVDALSQAITRRLDRLPSERDPISFSGNPILL